LKNAGIGFQNIVPVSSIPPVVEAKVEIDQNLGVTWIYIDKQRKKLIPPSTIIYVVQAINFGTEGSTISACIALAKITTKIYDESNIECLLAYEQTGEKEKETRNNAIEGLKALIKQKNGIVDYTWGENGFKTVCTTLEVKKKIGCVGAFVVFDPFTFQELE